MPSSRARFLVWFTCLLAAGSAGCDRGRYVARVLQVTPGGMEVGAEGLERGIRVTFDRPVAPGGAAGRAVAGAAFRIAPAIEGEARWLDAATLAFFPGGPLRTSTAYEVRLDPGLAVAANVSLARWVGARFVYRRIEVEELEVSGAAAFQPPLPVVTVRASLPIRARDAARACSFFVRGPDGTLQRRTAARPTAEVGTGRSVRLTPADPLPAATSFVFRCDHLPPAEGGEPQAGESVLALTTYGPAGVRRVAPVGSDVSADDVRVEVVFATPMDPAAVRAHVHVTTGDGQAVPVELAGDATATTFRWSGDLAPATAYRVTVDGGLDDVFGQPLGRPPAHAFQIGDASPRLRMDKGIFVVERASGRVPIWTRNLPHFAVRCAVVPEARLAAVLTGPANYDAWWDAADPRPVDHAKLGLHPRGRTVASAGARNQWFDASLALAETCGGGGSGVYLLEVDSQAEPRERRSLVSVTDLGLLAKVGNASSLVWVVRLSTGRPVADAVVRVRDLRGAVRFTGRSNADGVVLAPGASKLVDVQPQGEDGGWDDYRARRVIVTAQAGDDLAVLDTNWNNGIQVWNFGVAEDRGGGATRVRGFLHSDRGLYRPGDTVHLRGLVRRIDVAGRMSVPRGRTIKVVIEDPRGVALAEPELPVSAFGGFAHDLVVSPEARLGDYRVVGQLDGQTFHERFAVEEYRPRTFEVKVTSPRANVFVGDKLEFKLGASYLHGSPLRGAKVSWSLRRRARLPAFDGWDGYAFQDLAALWDSGLYWAESEERSFSEPVADGALVLDPAGKGAVVSTDAGTKPAGPQAYVFEATVEDASGASVTASEVVAGHRGNLYLGLHPSEFVQAVDMPFGVQVVAFDAEGKRRSAGVELTMTARRYVCRDGQCRQQPSAEPALRRKLTVPAAGSAAVERVVLREPGEYLVRVAAPDGRGGEAVSTQLVYLIGKGEAFWSGDEGDRMTIVASRPRYRPGETARLVPQAQLPGALALVTLERDGIVSYAVKPMPTTGEAIEIPVEARHAPNVFAGVALVRGRTGDGDAGRPRFRMGVVDLVVEAGDRRLTVAVETDRPSYQPGDRVRARVRVTGSGGQPVRAELALAVADEGVLQILGFKTPDPLPAFYAPWGLGVESASTWNRLLLRKDPDAPEDESGEGGDAGGDQAGRIRSRFMATAFWMPALVTSSRGLAEVTFTAPDNLTAYRVMAVAADTGERFGAGEQRLTIRKPLQVVPALPRFLSVGDRVEAAAVVHNNTDGALEVEVRLAAAGLELADGGPLRVTLPARGLTRVAFAANAPRAGQAVLTFRVSARGPGLADATLVKVPVERPSTPEVLVVGEGSTRGRVQHALPALGQIVPDRGALQVTVDRTGLARLDEGLRYLVGYPHGCVEQTTSKMVPMVALTDLARIAPLKDVSAEAARGFVESGIAKVLRHQHDDGGFGLWPGTPPAVHYTAFALWGLQVARAAGYAVHAPALESGARFLEQRLARGGPTGASAAEVLADGGDQAFASYVLATLGHADIGRLTTLHERRAQLPVFGRAFLARALELARRHDLAVALTGELAALAPGDGPALIREGDGDLGWYWSSDTRSTALVLSALLEIVPAHPAVPRLAEALLAQRVAGRWASTQENLYSVLALAELGKARAASGAGAATVAVGDKRLGRLELSGRTPARLRLPLEALGAGLLTIEATEGGGELFYSARLLVERPFEAAPRTDRGLSIERAYLDPDTGAPLLKLRLGQMARVRVRVTSTDRLAHVAVVDRLPGGLEPVLTRFQASSTGWDSPRAFWWERWETAWQQQELKDDRARLFADVLAAGTSEQRYLVRAVAVGSFAAPSATVEAMYRPDLNARSEAATVVVER